jgi:SAM-dependent methyltransferase
MVDIYAPETTDIDVETLMGLIRRRVHGLPDAGYIMGEIQRARLKADGIVTGQIQRAQLKAGDVVPTRAARTGWTTRVKSLVASFILRAVRRNLRFQEVFNHSVVGVLQLIAEDLHAYEQRLNVVGRLGENDCALEGGFDRAAYEEGHIDTRPFCLRSLLLFRELLHERDVALELFCGRGELLAAFAETGIEAVGVDPDAAMASVCRGRGLRALQADIFEYLRNSPDASYGGIFAGRVVERLTNDQTAELLALAGRKLRRGGIFVASATNIDHLPALRKFYMDPSLVRPVPARLMEFMVRRSGLRIHRFTFSGSVEHGAEELLETALSSEVYPYDEYTIVAVND